MKNEERIKEETKRVKEVKEKKEKICEQVTEKMKSRREKCNFSSGFGVCRTARVVKKERQCGLKKIWDVEVPKCRVGERGRGRMGHTRHIVS